MAKILIVEDDELMIRGLEKILKITGYETQTAENGQDGLIAAKNFKPDLILLDIMMPKLNGIQYLDQKAADPVIASIPVIVLSNLSDSLDVQKAMEKGAKKYIIKSEYDPAQIDAVIKEVLGGKTDSVPAPQPTDQPVPEQKTE